MNLNSKPAAAFQSIRPAKINFYLRSMRELGFAPEQVLSGTGLTEKALQQRFTLIQIPDYIRIVSNMMDLAQDPTLAFQLGSYLQAGDLGVLGCAFSASENVEQGMPIWQSYNRLFFGELISVRQFRQSHLQCFEFVPQVPLRPHLLQFFMEEKISVETALHSRLNQRNLDAQLFTVTYPRPAHAELYNEFLQLEVQFNAERILYGIDHRDESYHKRFSTANQELLEVCLAHLQKVSGIASSLATLAPQVKQLLMESLPEILPLSALAESFNMGKRTLCRNLESEQTSYHSLLAEVREELAKNYLLTTTMSADRIALQLGYEDTGSLRKAFKHWTGSTLKQYRDRNT